MLKYLILGLLGLAVAMAVYVRLAPTNVADWHEIDVQNEGGNAGAGGYFKRLQLLNQTGKLAALDQIIMATPRTQRLAGDVESGTITYVTRSGLWGFPDYTTVTLGGEGTSMGPTLMIYGRLRFGASDLGVNRDRIEGWCEQLSLQDTADTPTQ